MKELLKHGLYVDSKGRHGLTAIHVATTEKHSDMVQLLLVNGCEVNETIKNMISSLNLNEILQKREVGHCIAISNDDDSHNKITNDEERLLPLRVSIYRGHPLSRKLNNCSHPGKLMRMPNSLAQLKTIAGI